VYLLQAREAARTICVQQIQALTACGRGLTPPEEDMFDLDPDATVAVAKEVEETRHTPALQVLRDRMIALIRGVMETWPVDAEIGDVSPSTGLASQFSLSPASGRP
jgi:hypothetical protein